MTQTVNQYAIPEHEAKMLLRVAKHILEEPTRYDQSRWLADNSDSPCGTAGCIAGWLVALHQTSSMESLSETLRYLKRSGEAYIQQTALDIFSPVTRLMISDSYLFTGTPVGSWPEPFTSQWQEANRQYWFTSDFNQLTKTRAEIAAARIEHFVRTGM